MNPRREGRRLPDWKLERYLLGELESEEMARIRTELEGDEALRGRVEALRQSNQEILERYPADWMGRQIRRKLEGPAAIDLKNRRRTLGFRFWQIPALSAAALAVALLFLLPGSDERGGNTQDRPGWTAGTRVKGLDPQLRLFRKTDLGSERLENGATAREGDPILVQYEAAGRGYGVIVSVDGNGSMTRHAPLEGSQALRLEQGGAVPLSFSYELDDAPRWEKFYFVTADSSFICDTVFQAVRELTSDADEARGDSLRLPPLLNQTIFTLEKEPIHE